MKHKIYVVGIGPGAEEMMTKEAENVLKMSDTIIGYEVYLKLLPAAFWGKELLSTPMKQEKERCLLCFEKARSGKTVSLVCSGDAGIYGLAGLMYELGEAYPDCEIMVVSGVTAAAGGAALLGAPINHDFCAISLSDLLTPWETIERRLLSAAEGDFAIVIYNPSSRKRKDYLKRACEILLTKIEKERPAGYVENIGRTDTKIEICTLGELKDRSVNMFTTVFIGNSRTEVINGKLITRRGYEL